VRDKLIYILGVLAVILLARDLYLITGFPPERNQGVIFKIIFFHVPMAITALTCAMVAFISSVLFLVTTPGMIALAVALVVHRRVGSHAVAYRVVDAMVTNGGYGYVVDNLTCYNVLSGASMCTILLDPPKYCHLFINPKSKNPDSEHFDVPCPVEWAMTRASETLAMDRTAPPTPDAPEYPQYWEADVVASDGGVVHLRPILPSDADAILEFHSRLSARTRYLRYFGAYFFADLCGNWIKYLRTDGSVGDFATGVTSPVAKNTLPTIKQV